MTKTGLQRWLVALLATASVGTTTLVGLNVLGRRDQTATRPDRLPGEAIEPTHAQRLPVLVTLPPFQLTDQSGSAFGSQQLRGKVWIASFIFSRCAGPCPMITSQMAQLQTQLSPHPAWDDIRLVSISVDPEHDTPFVLAQYAKLAHADPAHWRFLTGNRPDVWHLVQSGFKLPVDQAEADDPMPIVHSQKFVLVDRVGHIRGFYDGLETDGQHQLLADLERLLKHPPPVAPGSHTTPNVGSNR